MYKQIVRISAPTVRLCEKIALLSVLLCTLTQHASHTTPWLEIKPSYFFFSAFPLKDIYDCGGFEIQGSASLPLRCNLDMYGSVGFRQAWGRALNSCEKTNLIVVPFDIGLKPVFNFWERFYSFFAIGPRFFYFHQRNHSPYVDCTIHGGGVGFFVNTGFNVVLAEHFLLGIFGEYSYEKKAICPRVPNVYSNGSVQMGGFAFGVSLGYAF
jgi:hypothetical protein